MWTVHSSPPGRSTRPAPAEQRLRRAGVHGPAEVEGWIAHDQIDRAGRQLTRRVVADDLDPLPHAVRVGGGARRRDGGRGPVGGDDPQLRPRPRQHRRENAGATPEVDADAGVGRHRVEMGEQEPRPDVEARTGERAAVRDHGQPDVGQVRTDRERRVADGARSGRDQHPRLLPTPRRGDRLEHTGENLVHGGRHVLVPSAGVERDLWRCPSRDRVGEFGQLVEPPWQPNTTTRAPSSSSGPSARLR